MTITQAILEKVQNLTPQQQEQVLNFIESLNLLSQKQDTPQKSPEELGWPAGFFEEVIGGWVGEPLERPDQGEYEIREVLAFIDLLENDEWELLYKGRFKKLQQEIKVGIEAANRGEVVDAQEVFHRLHEKLQQKHNS
jgi:hypothetical protein